MLRLLYEFLNKTQEHEFGFDDLGNNFSYKLRLAKLDGDYLVEDDHFHFVKFISALGFISPYNPNPF